MKNRVEQRSDAPFAICMLLLAGLCAGVCSDEPLPAEGSVIAAAKGEGRWRIQ